MAILGQNIGGQGSGITLDQKVGYQPMFVSPSFFALRCV